MTHRRRNLACSTAFITLITLAGLSAGSAAAADMTIVSTVTTNGKSTTATQYLTDSRVRYSDGENDTILELDSGKIIYIDHAKKKYAETSLDELAAQMAELDKMLKDNPMLEKMLGSAGTAEVTAQSETREIAGYTTKRYTASVGMGITMELWAAPELEMPTSYFDAYKMRYAAMGPMGARFNKLFDEMREIGGFPLATTTSMSMMGRDFDSEQVATDVKIGPVPSNAFDIPSDYKQKKNAYK